jgi:asparagine synthase (glutamine-hydrolysing)
MCGIAGMVGFARNSVVSLENALRVIRHRGPDDEGIFSDSDVVLGMRRLAIVGVDSGKQPDISADQRVITVFNGEIYNFLALKRDLEKRGHKFHTEGDTEVITHLYLEYGIDFVKKLDGMFAIAIWDKSVKTLYLVRDRLGKKPLWYFQEKECFFFASELKSLIEFGLRKEIRFDLIKDTLTDGYSNAPLSPFRDAFQVEPATFISLRFGRKEIVKYWSPNILNYENLEDIEALSIFENLFLEAVQKRMYAERPIGVFLSGGVDSSLVAAYTAQIASKKIDTFSVGFSNTHFDESVYAREVSNVLGTNHHELIVEPDAVFLVETLSKILDQPFADSSIIPTVLLSRFARENCVVALGGDGGDEGFGGYSRYKYMQKVVQFGPLMPKSLLRRFLGLHLSDKHSRILRTLTAPNVSNAYENMQSLISEDVIQKLVSSKHSLKDESLFDHSKLEFEVNSVLRSMQLVDLKSYLPGDLLYKADMATMSAGLELRSPFLDYKLVEYGLSLPDKFKIRRGQTKWVVKQALKKYLPQDIVNRPKMGFGIPRANWLRGSFRDVSHDLLLSQRTRERGWFNTDEISKIVKRHEKGLDYNTTIWPLMVLELWARNWIDSNN